ncbi:MAG: holo-ACP synthase [Myxococcales bacterium]|nr:holo-ACP synthase [Myxococcales bacterium]
MAVLGLGLDVCSVERIRRLLEGPRARRFLDRVYTRAEQKACSGRADAVASYAARFAAKEALVKALGAPPGIRWTEMEVVREGGVPRFKLEGAAGREVDRRGACVLLALTHDAGIAVAAVVLEGARA